MKPINIGIQSFSSIRERDCFYIDKTAFIQEWWESEDDVTLITRPRRFGKTMNMNMLECFFSNQYEGRSDLFEGLYIWENEKCQKKYQELQGSYPVIFLSFASVKETTFAKTYQMICKILFVLYQKYYFLIESDILTEQEKEQFTSVNMDMDTTTAITAINDLSNYLSRYYGKNVIILLDEYDTPLQEAYISGYWDEMAPFIRTMFNATFKTNPYLCRAVLTGITRITKESIFSDLNNLNIVTTTTEQYETAFGFTQQEVSSALELYHMESEKESLKDWYDGFTFGKYTDIYNPWSIINFLKWKKCDPYWVNTSSNALIGSLIQQGSADLKTKVENLLQGGELTTFIDEQVVFIQLDKNENAIWSLMLASGYLKVSECRQNPETGEYSYRLALTNREVKIMMRRLIHEWFDEANYYNNFVKALLLGDIDAMNDYMNDIALQSFSNFDTGKKPSGKAEPERFYHGFVLGLIVDLAKEYKIRSNRESGFGRYDIIIEPFDRKQDAIIIEFKVYNPRKEKNIEDTVNAALRQIEEKRYDEELVSSGFTAEGIRHYGFAFEGKTVLIGGK